MNYIDVSVKVPKEVWELGQAISKIIVATKQSQDDGFQAGDVPAILTAVLPEMYKAVSGLDKVSGEMAQDPGAFAKAIGLSIADVLTVIKK